MGLMLWYIKIFYGLFKFQLEMLFAMHTLICAECNLQVPLSSLSISSNDKKHIKLQRLLVSIL